MRRLLWLVVVVVIGCGRGVSSPGSPGDAGGPPVGDASGLDGTSCLLSGQDCGYYDLIDPAHATLRDHQSFRQAVETYCLTPTERQVQLQRLCTYQETCQMQGNQPACVACGEVGRNVLQRSLDGTVTDDCAGCSCSGWAVYGCFSDANNFYHQPFVDLVFQSSFHDGYTALRLAIGADGSLLNPSSIAAIGTLASFQLTPTSIAISQGGLFEVDLDLAADVAPVTGGPAQRWHITSHIVHRCPGP